MVHVRLCLSCSLSCASPCTTCPVRRRSLYVLVNARADKGITPLHLAAMNGHPETLGLLLDAGARVNAMTRSDGDFLDVSVMGKPRRLSGRICHG